jgi:hypothetical protein
LHYLKKTIPAILNLKYQNYELIVVDNASVDGSIQFLETFGSSIIIVKNTENFGYSLGKNIGASLASGDYIFLLDNDILITEDSLLECLLLELSQIGEKNMISVVMLNDGEKVTKYYSYCYGIFGPIYNSNVDILKITPGVYPSGAPMGGNIFLTKETWNSIGGFDVTQPYYLDDFDFGARGYIFGFKSFVTSKHILTHLGVDQSTSKDKWLWKYKYFFSGYSMVIFKNYTTLNILLRYPLFLLFSILKTIKYSLKFFSVEPILSFAWSILFFVKKLPDIYKERKKIQSKRIEIYDLFFKITPPKFK